MEINYLAPATIVRKILPRMIEKRKGHIVNIASIYGMSSSKIMFKITF